MSALSNPATGAPRPRAGLRVCLAASGGGHLRQLLDMEPAWGGFDHFFLTEDTALSASVARNHRTHVIPHVALGQGRLGAPGKMLVAAIRNLWASAKVILRERPDVLISTGAGAAFFAVFWARLLGAKVVIIESFARFHRPSMFARLAAPLAHHMVVQSAALAAVWPRAAVFDPLRILDAPPPAKQPLLFVTVGATLPFDRMVEMVAEAKRGGAIPERVLAQVGHGAAATSADYDSVESLSFEEMQETLAQADIVVCHGGTGSLIMALRHGCRVIAVPRLFDRGEHYDDHQAQITKAFADRGLIAVANSAKELVAALDKVRNKPPVLATTDPSGLIDHLKTIFASTRPPRTRRALDPVARCAEAVEGD